MSSPPPVVPKASLYYYHKSIWASVALLALEEKGYGPDEVDLKEVDLSKGENFAPSYLRINNNATVPTLVVPLETTLDPDIESRYKAIKDTKSIVDFLDRSRSPQSRTHTTSSAPAPTLTPATIAFSNASNKVIDLLQSPSADPNALMFLNAQDDSSLKIISATLRPILQAKVDALDQLIKANEEADTRLSEKTVQFWKLRRAASDMMLDVIEEGDKPSDQLDEAGKKKREEFFKAAGGAWSSLRDVLLQLSADMIGPYVLGDQISLADLHLAAWLSRIALLSGAAAGDSGNAVVAKIEEHIGGSLGLPQDLSVAEARRRAGLPATHVSPTERQARLAAFWDAIKERPSWKKVYQDGLH